MSTSKSSIKKCPHIAATISMMAFRQRSGTLIMNHKSGFIIRTAHVFCKKILIEHTPKNFLASLKHSLVLLCKEYRSTSEHHYSKKKKYEHLWEKFNFPFCSHYSYYSFTALVFYIPIARESSFVMPSVGKSSPSPVINSLMGKP